MKTITELQEALMGGAFLNLHRTTAGDWKAHLKVTDGWRTAQKDHATLEEALLEHFGAQEDEDLLI